MKTLTKLKFTLKYDYSNTVIILNHRQSVNAVLMSIINYGIIFTGVKTNQKIDLCITHEFKLLS